VLKSNQITTRLIKHASKDAKTCDVRIARFRIFRCVKTMRSELNG